MKKLIPFIAFIILSFLASCGIASQELNVETSSTSTPIPSAATESPANTPFATLTPTVPPSPVPPSIAASYNVPKWLGNFDYTVVMAITSITANSNQLTFFNINTQERYDISLPITSLSHYFWTTDGESFGLLSRDRKTVFVVSTNTGLTSKYSLTEKASTCLQEYFDNRGAPENEFILSKMWVYDISPESETFFCEPSSNFNFPDVKAPVEFSSPIAWSHNQQFYIAKSLTGENDGLPCIINRSGKVTKCLTAINEQFYSNGLDLVRWSKDDNQIYYVQFEDSVRADLCIYQLASDATTCPTEKISELDGYNIEYYDMSDDEEFFKVLYGSSCSKCDFWGEPSSLVLRKDGTDILFMGKELQEPNTHWAYPFFSSLFRPNQ
jgi:hypothetical protein